MAQPTTRTEFKNYVLRKLGAPVLDINLASEQCEDLIDDALQFFYERQLGEIVDVLFPTSAIAGLPKDEAFAEISRSENHDRSFYSGFLGQIENERSRLYKNKTKCYNTRST